MKKIYLVMGLIAALFFLDSPTVAAGQQDIMLVIDNSGSMQKSDPDVRTKTAVSDLIKELAEEDRVGIVIFDESARLSVPLTLLDAPASRKKVLNSLAQLDYHGQRTNTPTAIERAVYELRTKGRRTSRFSIILLTDGIIDTGDKRKDAELTTWLIENLTGECSKLGIKLFGVAFTENADFHLIQSLASKTDGGYYRSLNADEISKAFKEIVKRLAPINKIPPPIFPASVDIPYRPVETNTDLVTNMASNEIKPNVLDSIHLLFLEHLRWITSLLAIVSALCLIFFLFLRQKKRLPQKPGPDSPVKEEDSSNAQPEAQLLCVNEGETDTAEPNLLFILDKHKVTIGRASENSIVIPESTISNFHATIQYVGGHFQLEDNHSTNGTFLDNNRLEPNQPVMLEHGDIIRFATFDFRFLRTDSTLTDSTIIMTQNIKVNS